MVYEQRLNKMAVDLNIPQHTLGVLLGIDRSAVCKIQRNQRNLRPDEVQRSEELIVDLYAIAADAKPLTIDFRDAATVKLLVGFRKAGLHLQVTFKRDGAPVEE